MAGEYLATLGDTSQISTIFQGEHLLGNADDHRGKRFSQPRIAVVGRSNVGKSSLINALVEARVAQTSNQPGKTRAIHFYLWKGLSKIIADLPGYGYARASHDERKRWARFIEAYFKHDMGIERALVLLDGRHGPTELDLEAIGFLSLSGVPVTFVFTKADTLKTQSERAVRQKEVKVALEKFCKGPVPHFWVSSKTGKGLAELVKELQ